MTILQKQISPVGKERSIYSQVDSLANPLASQDLEKEKTTTVISGRKCFEQYERYNRVGLSVKMLLESSQWYNPVMKLQWKVKPLCLKRLTRKRYSNKSTLSKPSVEILNVKDIPSSRLLFRLVPSVRLIGGIGFGLLPTVQTQGLKTCRNGKTVFADLSLLPTPQARDWKGISIAEGKRMRGEKTSFGSTLPDLVRRVTGKTSQLNPLFVAEMMGFPPDWTVSPFVGGERSQ